MFAILKPSAWNSTLISFTLSRSCIVHFAITKRIFLFNTWTVEFDQSVRTFKIASTYSLLSNALTFAHFSLSFPISADLCFLFWHGQVETRKLYCDSVAVLLVLTISFSVSVIDLFESSIDCYQWQNFVSTASVVKFCLLTHFSLCIGFSFWFPRLTSFDWLIFSKINFAGLRVQFALEMFNLLFVVCLSRSIWNIYWISYILLVFHFKYQIAWRLDKSKLIFFKHLYSALFCLSFIWFFVFVFFFLVGFGLVFHHFHYHIIIIFWFSIFVSYSLKHGFRNKLLWHLFCFK